MSQRLVGFLAALMDLRSGIRLGIRLLAAASLCILGATAPARADDVSIDLVEFGAGNAVRPGDWLGIRLALTSNIQEPVNVEVAWEIPNADGDICENTRSVTLTPNVKVERWLYGRLPPSTQPFDLLQTPYLVRVYEVVDGRRVREVGAARISGATAQTPATGYDMDQDIFLVMGDRRLGLEQYKETIISGFSAPPGLQCRTETVTGGTVKDLPDRWEGLSSFSAIIWCEPTTRPAELQSEQAKALLEWVWRGGTLVIGIGGAADIWGIGRPGTHPLEPILPTALPNTSDMLINDLLPILSKYDVSLSRDAKRATRVWSWDATKLDKGYRPLLALPQPKANPTPFLATKLHPFDGMVVGIQRSYGYGFIVLLGLDVDEIYARQVLPNIPVPQADIFWNRVLGRRGDTPTNDEVTRLGESSASQMLTTLNGTTSSLGDGQLIAQQIGMQGKAAINVLAAAALFITYWVLSGPLGFMSLRQFKRDRYSWLLFVGLAFLFTAVAWAGGSLISSNRPTLRHVTVLDQLAKDPAKPDTNEGAPEQRATAWLSVSLPGYGLTPLAIGSDATNTTNLLYSWAPPPNGTGETFPNKDRYRVDVDSEASYRVPARRTSADFIARWRGTVDPKWGSLINVEQKIEFVPDPAQPRGFSLAGTVKSGLPGALEQVRIILVSPVRAPLPAVEKGVKQPGQARPDARQPQLAGLMLSPEKDTWASGEVFDLGEFRTSKFGLGSQASLERNLDEYAEKIKVQAYGVNPFDSPTEARRREFMEMLTFYWMLKPPAWYRSQGDQSAQARAGRLMAREIDLSPWFTRPCLIITGFLNDSACPVPVSVDGEHIAGSGVTMVRWIYPLDTPDYYAIPDLIVPEDTEDSEKAPISGDESAPASDN